MPSASHAVCLIHIVMSSLRLLCADFGVGLDGDVIVGREGVDLVLGEFGAGVIVSI
jgi:hypothetical protein